MPVSRKQPNKTEKRRCEGRALDNEYCTRCQKHTSVHKMSRLVGNPTVGFLDEWIAGNDDPEYTEKQQTVHSLDLRKAKQHYEFDNNIIESGEKRVSHKVTVPKKIWKILRYENPFGLYKKLYKI